MNQATVLKKPHLLTTLLIAAAPVLAFVAGCGGAPTTIKIDGSSTVFPISEKVAEEFSKQNPGTRITVNFSGTGGGMSSFSKGEIDICDASRPMKPGEKEACDAAGIAFTEFTVAYDGIAVVVNKENDWCDSLTVEQLKEMWREGSPIKKWSDLNPEWPDQELVLYGPDENSGTYEYFNKDAILGKEIAVRDDYNPSANDNQLVRGVQQDKGALGYFGFAYYEENKDTLKLLGVDPGTGPVQPSLDTVRSNEYKPLSRPLFIYMANNSLKNKGFPEFVKFYLTNAGKYASEVGYVPAPEETYSGNTDAFMAAQGQ